MKKMSTTVLVIILFLMTALVGCGKNTEVNRNPSEPSASGPVSLSVGLSKLATNAPLYIALEKDFFKDENLDVNFKYLDAPNAINVAVASGSVDIGANGLSADLYNIVASGEKLVIVADKGKEEKGFPTTAVMVSNDSPIKSIEDLKGKKVGITSIGSSNQYKMGRILEKHGLTTKDVQWVPLNTINGMVEALRGKGVDAIVVNEPTVSVSVKQGYAKVLLWASDEIKTQTGAVFFSPKFAANKDAGVRFLKGYLKGSHYYYDAVLTHKDGKLVKGQNYDEVVKIIAKYTGQEEDVIKGSLSFNDPKGKLNIDDIQSQIDWYAKEKFLTKPLDTKDMVNTELLAEALKVVGK